MQKFIYEYEQEIKDKIISNIYISDKIAFRKQYFSTDFYFFCKFYFYKAFTYIEEDFHKWWYKIATTNENLLIIAFRESGKTAIFGLMYIIYCIVYKKEEFILFLAFDKGQATEKLRNIITVLKTNRRLIHDFGFLYEDEETRKRNIDKMSQTKSVSKFITKNGIKLQALGLKTSSRGMQLVDEEGNILRPSLVLGDDIDVSASVSNIAVIDKNYKFITGELFGAIKGRCIFLGNIIGMDGVNIRLRDNYAKKSGAWIYSEKAIIENGEITWKDRYVWTLQEANKLNETLEKSRKKKDIETLQVNKYTFDPEYMNIPSMYVGNPVFDTNSILRLESKEVKKRFKITIEDRIVFLDIYQDNFDKEYYKYTYLGMDTAGGQGGDSDYTDITMLDKNGKLFGRVTSNIINYKHSKKLFDILYEDFKILFFKNSLGIERNFYGESLIEELKESSHIFKSIYIPTTVAKRRTQYTQIVGWQTSGTSKEKMIEDMRVALSLGKIEVDEKVKLEMRGYVQEKEGDKIVYKNDIQVCMHDDSVISYCIALQMFINSNPNYLQS